MLDYGFNFMNTKIYIDNESTICIAKNPVYHSKTKYIAIRHHFIRDAYEKKLIQVLKIHTDDNVADLLTKAFDVSRFQFLVCAEAFLTIGDQFQEVHWVFKSPWEEIKTHNMVAYLEKFEGNAKFHEVIDFLARSSIYHAPTRKIERALKNDKVYNWETTTYGKIMYDEDTLTSELEFSSEPTVIVFVGIKSLLDAVRIIAAYICVNDAQLELVLLRDFKENMLSVYYC
ncbi:hypothetical protein Tco_1065682 [Tanacetum coccineum]